MNRCFAASTLLALAMGCFNETTSPLLPTSTGETVTLDRNLPTVQTSGATLAFREDLEPRVGFNFVYLARVTIEETGGAWGADLILAAIHVDSRGSAGSLAAGDIAGQTGSARLERGSRRDLTLAFSISDEIVCTESVALMFRGESDGEPISTQGDLRPNFQFFARGIACP